MATNTDSAGDKAAVGQGEASAFERIGGAPTIRLAVDELYQLILDDPDLAGYFEDVELPRLKAHMADLLTKVLGGPDRYAGRDLEEGHRGLGITAEHYGKVGDHLIGLLERLGAPADIVAAVAETLQAVSDQIIERPTSVEASAGSGRDG